MEENNKTPLFELYIDHESSSHLSDTARWAKFLAIVGFVTCGLLAILSFFIGSILATTALTPYTANGIGAIGGAFITIIYLVIAGLYFFPCLFLYNFSVRLKAALRNHDQVKLNESLKSQKALFRYVGIFTIVILSFYALALIIVGAAALFVPH